MATIMTTAPTGAAAHGDEGNDMIVNYVRRWMHIITPFLMAMMIMASLFALDGNGANNYDLDIIGNLWVGEIAICGGPTGYYEIFLHGFKRGNINHWCSYMIQQSAGQVTKFLFIFALSFLATILVYCWVATPGFMLGVQS